MSDGFRFSPDILARLGEELVPDADQGIIELAKNAYDADASTCVVRLEAVNSGEGTITICDDGVGMTLGEAAEDRDRDLPSRSGGRQGPRAPRRASPRRTGPSGNQAGERTGY